MAETEMTETEVPEAETAEFDVECWNQIKKQLDELELKYTGKPEEGTFTLVYHWKEMSMPLFLNVIVKKYYYRCIGVLCCSVLESQRDAVDLYLMRVNRDLLYENGKFITDYENNVICFSESESNPERAILSLVWTIGQFKKFKMGFLGVCSALLSVEQAAKLEKETPSGGEKEICELVEALRNTSAP